MLWRVRKTDVVGVGTLVVKGGRVKRGGAGGCGTCADIIRCVGCCVSVVDEYRRLVDMTGCCWACIELVCSAGCCEACDRPGLSLEW